MTRGLPIRSVTIDGKRTSIRLDERSWDALKEICRRESMPVGHYLTRINRARGSEPLSTAARAALIGYYKEDAEQIVPASIAAEISELTRRHRRALVRNSFETESGGCQRKLEFASDALPEMEPGTLSEAWRDWCELRAERGGLPDLNAFTGRPRRAEALYNFLDLTPEDPYNFTGLSVTPTSPELTGFNLTGHRIGEYPFRLHREGMQADFNAAKHGARPIYHILHQRFGSMERTYARLVLPFSADGLKVDRLVTIVRRIARAHAVSADHDEDEGLFGGV